MGGEEEKKKRNNKQPDDHSNIVDLCYFHLLCNVSETARGGSGRPPFRRFFRGLQ